MSVIWPGMKPAIPADVASRYRELAEAQSRENFHVYCQYIDQKMIVGWWQREIALQLQKFKDDLLAGFAPRLIIQAPPQHGKSRKIVDFLSWLIGHDPSLKCIYASFSERLGVRANLRLQRILDTEKYQGIFPTRIGGLRNREIVEFVEAEGYFRNTTVRGSITGESLDLGIIDDPIKGREEANSQTVRDKTYDWLMDDFFTRFSEKAGLLVILTRWHVDDPIGRLIEADKSIKLLSYPAIAEVDETHRRAGQPLFPEHKSLDFLLEQKGRMAPENWEALYQQNPVMKGGNLFKDEWLQEYTDCPPLAWRAVYVDTAQKTKEKNDFSVFQHWGRTKDGKAVLIDVVRGRFEAPELEATAVAFWNKCKNYNTEYYGHLRKMAVEDKVSGTGLIQAIKRKSIPVQAIQRTVDKYTRALDVVPSFASGLVMIPRSAKWRPDFMAEYVAFPDGAFDDQMDPMIDAVLEMCGKATFRYSEEALS